MKEEANPPFPPLAVVKPWMRFSAPWPFRGWAYLPFFTAFFLYLFVFIKEEEKRRSSRSNDYFSKSWANRGYWEQTVDFDSQTVGHVFSTINDLASRGHAIHGFFLCAPHPDGPETGAFRSIFP
ncbi:hypothetical protein [Chromobacterium sphagni]|uniref:hypothetical protein n=1 Tax=Chromobacterium sphagni TaxID=1903179 RepID=UPI001114698F|nr:hypothetical protein [Chromobacterium sphagni]